MLNSDQNEREEVFVRKVLPDSLAQAKMLNSDQNEREEVFVRKVLPDSLAQAKMLQLGGEKPTR